MIIPCAKCGRETEGKRITKTCDDCRRERRREYYQENRDAIKATVSLWKVANPDRRRKHQRDIYHRNKLRRLRKHVIID